MKKKVAVLALGAFLMTGLFGCGDKVPEGTVATVNGTPISQEVLDENYNMVLRQYESYYGLDVTADDLKLEVRNATIRCRKPSRQNCLTLRRVRLRV